MKRLICILVFAGMFFRLAAHLPPYSAGECVFNRQTIAYTENKKQWNQKILFKAELPQGALFLEKNTLTYLLHHPDNEKFYHQHALGDTSLLPKQGEVLRHHAYKMHFVNANENVSLFSENAAEDYENYFIGNNPDNWATGVKSYQTVVYKNLYPNIDMKLYSHENQIKYDLILHAGAVHKQILFEYEGLDKMEIKKGNLILHTSVGEQIEGKPEAYQIINKKKKKIGAKYVLVENRLTFELDNYNKQYPLIIDPVVYFGTYSGSRANNWGYAATYDNDGNVYMGGIVFNDLDTNYPVSTGAYKTVYGGGGCDVAIMKLNPECSQRLYATYLGGSGVEMPHSMVINELNELIVYGTTGSDNFPTTANAYQKIFNRGTFVNYLNARDLSFPNGTDIFISKFSSDGSKLQASTYIGGSGNDGLNYKSSFNSYVDTWGNDSLYASYGDGARGELIADNQGNIYVGSCSFSSDFPVTSNSFQPHSGGGQDGIVFKLDGNLSNLIWSSYLGGSGDDAVYSVFTDSEYNVVVTGGTNSANFPVSSDAYQKQYGGGSADAFVTKISSVGNIILASTYFGTPEYDQSFFVRLDKEDNIYLLGQTKGGETSLVHSSQYFVEDGSQFVSQFNPNLSVLNWSTMFGSGRKALSPDLSLSAFGVDRCKRTYISGWGRFFISEMRRGDTNFGTKGLFTTNDAYQKETDGQDFYILCLNPEASSVSYASFVGELSDGRTIAGIDHVDGGTSRISKFGTLYQSVCASCGSSQAGKFPTSDSAYARQKGEKVNCNNLVFTMAIHDDFPVADFTLNHSSGCAPLTVEVKNTGRGDSFFWDFGNGQTSIQENNTIYYSTSGIYTITLITGINNSMSFCGADTIQKTVIVLGRSYSLPSIKTCPNIPVQIGLLPMEGLTYSWIPTAGLSDSSVSNPFATVNQNTLFKLTIFDGFCSDTVSQWIIIDTLVLDAGNDFNTCVSPQIVTAHSNKSTDIFYHWSSNNLFTDTLNASPTDSMAIIYIEKEQFYYVKAETKQGCVAIDSVKGDFKSIFDIYTMETIKCYEDCTAKIRISPSQYITPPAHYYWNGVEISDISIGIDNLCAGEYHVLVTDTAGCSQERILEIKQPEEIIITPSIVHASCKDVCNGSILANVKGGTSPYTYKWSTGDTTSYIENLCIGNYSLTITDANGCKTTNNFEISIEGTIFLNMTEIPNTCRPYCTGGVRVEISTTKYPIVSVKWNTGDTAKAVNDLCAGTYTVTVTDSLGCQIFRSVTVDNRYTFDTMKVWADTTTILEMETTQLHATKKDYVTYSWSPSVGLSDPSEPTTQAQPNKTTTYYLQASDSRGCVYIDSITINVIPIECGEPTFFIPNAFTPNEDGKNDMFCIESNWVVSYSLLIYNRWGEKVFETGDPEKCWDGTYKGKECESGVYVYSLEVQCKANKSFKKKGDITLIR